MAAFLKIFLNFSWTERPTDWKLGRKFYVAKIILTRNPRWPPWPPTWKPIWTSSPEPTGQLTGNLVDSFGATWRSKIAQIVPIRNQRWWPSWKFISSFFIWTERPFDSKFGAGIGATCRSKIVKIVPIRNPRWLPWQPSWKLFWTSELKGQLTWNLVESIRASCRAKVA